jgi:ribosomal protein S12 methylthiotransferase accessory factor
MNALPIVYLGPSLPLAEARAILAADYRPPVRRGDLPEDCAGRAVVIIDGEFGQNLSVSPKEILRLLDGGASVLGASSMGALRAAELHTCGMEGAGWVFDAYRSGRITGDDEVALAYSPIDASPVTVPLVNVRCWAERLRADGHIDATLARRVLRRAQAIFYADRTPARLHKELGSVLGEEKFQALLRLSGGAVTDVKAEDARLALARTAAVSQQQSALRGDSNDGNEEEVYEESREEGLEERRKERRQEGRQEGRGDRRKQRL